MNRSYLFQNKFVCLGFLVVCALAVSGYKVGSNDAESIKVQKEKITRLQTRVLVDNAALVTDDNDTKDTWLPDAQSGAHWILKNSTLASMPNTNKRLIAISGTSKTSLGDSVAIGLSGAIINDAPNKTGWALYSDVQHKMGLQSFGLEVAAKNLSEKNPTASPYDLGPGVYGVWLAGGGDKAYGGKPENPSNAAIAILSNASTWNRGIVFEDEGITGTDGINGTGVAIEMAKGHVIEWKNRSSNVANIGIEGNDGTINIVATPAGQNGKFKTPRLNISNIPTSSNGLESGDVWNDHGSLKIIP